MNLATIAARVLLVLVVAGAALWLLLAIERLWFRRRTTHRGEPVGTPQPSLSLWTPGRRNEGPDR